MKKKEKESLRKIVIIGLVLVVGYLGYQSMTSGSSPFSEASEPGMEEPLIPSPGTEGDTSTITPLCLVYEDKVECEKKSQTKDGETRKCRWRPERSYAAYCHGLEGCTGIGKASCENKPSGCKWTKPGEFPNNDPFYRCTGENEWCKYRVGKNTCERPNNCVWIEEQNITAKCVAGRLAS